jgi:molecular chaperone DnaK (HSP70)
VLLIRAREYSAVFQDRAHSNVFFSGKSQQITIENNKGRLTQEEIERMVREAEEFASEDDAQRKRVEALNSLSAFVFGLKTQLADQEGLGGKVRRQPIYAT